MYLTIDYQINDLAGINQLRIGTAIISVLAVVFAFYKVLDIELKRRSRNKLISGSYNKEGTYRKHATQARMITALAFISGIAGGKLFYIVSHVSAFVETPIDILFSAGGFEVSGGVVCGAAAVLIYCRRIEFKCVHLFDSLAPALLLASSIIAIGYFLFGYKNWENGQPSEIDFTSLYESILFLAAFIVLWSLRKRVKTTGIIFTWYLLFMGIEFFLVGKLRFGIDIHLLGFKMNEYNFLAVLFLSAGFVRFVSIVGNAFSEENEFLGQ